MSARQARQERGWEAGAITHPSQRDRALGALSGRLVALSTARKARYRARCRSGRQVLSIEVGPEVIEAMLVRGWVTDETSRQREVLASAIEEALQDWAGKALKD